MAIRETTIHDATCLIFLSSEKKKKLPRVKKAHVKTLDPCIVTQKCENVLNNRGTTWTPKMILNDLPLVHYSNLAQLL